MHLLGRAPFGQLWLAQFVSQLGTAAFRVALVWYVVEVSEAPEALGVVLVAFTLPQLFAGIVGGFLADRHDRKVITILSDTASGLVFLVMWLLAVADRLDLPVLIVLAFLAGTSTAVLEPTVGALLPSLVEDTELQNANSLRAVGSQGAAIVGPAVAGVAIGVVGVDAFFLANAISFFLAVALFLPAPVRCRCSSLP